MEIPALSYTTGELSRVLSRREPQAGRAGGRSGDGAANAGPDPAELRRLREAAQRDGDFRRAQALDEEERAAYARLHGAGPIVGRAGRNM